MTSHKGLQVVHIITKLELGGAQKVCLSIIEGLQEEGHTALLISGNEGPLVKRTHRLKHALLLPSFKREISLVGLFGEFKTMFAIIKHLRMLKKEYPDLIVHTHSTKAGILGRWAALFAGVKKRIHTIHGYAFHAHQPWYIRALIYTAELITSTITTHFVCVSSHDINIGKRHFPLFSNKNTLIRAAVDQELFYRPAHPECQTQAPVLRSSQSEGGKCTEGFVFGTIACFKKQKNLFDLLNAFHSVHTQSIIPVRLEIIGDGIQRPTIEAWIAEHKLNDHIKLLGWQKDIAPHMRGWDAFVLSSLWEGLPCAIVEARLFNLPVVTYNTGGISDIIINEVNGLLIKQLDWQGLANAMMRIMNDKDLYQKLSFYKDDLQAFNQRVMLKQHVALYRKMNE